jgi:iron complex outermembrane receptor protein
LLSTVRIVSGLFGILLTALASDGLAAAGDPADLPLAGVRGDVLQVIVVQSTAIPGSSIDIDKIPGNVQVFSAEDLARDGSASLTNALNADLSSVNVNDDLDDPFQPDILYRGFEASPVLGTPQGLAVYQNGVRINEAFGDTVNWDLFPDIAINRVSLVSSSPVYGLNALGGAISMTMKNGFSYQGTDLELSGGSYGQDAATAQYGANSGKFGIYLAGKALDWTGWREFSDDRLRQFYAAFSAHTDSATLDVSYTRADNQLNGQGSAPVQELAANRAAVFTGPQTNLNRLDFVTLNGTLALTGTWSLEGVLYYRHYAQTVANGNTTDYGACTNTAGILCQPDGITPLVNSAGQALPDISEGGAVAIGENDFESIQAWGRGAALQASSGEPFFGYGNQLIVGAALDEASTYFYSGAQIGVINSQLQVLPSNLIVDTPENSAGAIGNGDPVPVSVDSRNRNLGVYLTDTLDVTSNVAVTASARYTLSHIDLYDQLGSNLSGNNRYDHFNPAIGATYKVLPTVTVYGGISQNTRTPTASEIECSNPLAPCLLPTNLAGDPPNLRQVIARTSELGVRGRVLAPAGRANELSWNLSAFRTLLHDDIYGIATSVSQGFFQNIGDTRRQGAEAGLKWIAGHWSGNLNYSFVQATFRSPLRVPSPSHPFQDPSGDVQVEPGDYLPGMPEHRLKLGLDYRVLPGWTFGLTLSVVSGFYYVGDESNQLAPIPGYQVVGLHCSYKPSTHVELFAQIANLLDRKYATWGILSDPTGVGAAGIPPDAVTNGPGVDNRFLSPAAPIEVFGGVRMNF